MSTGKEGKEEREKAIAKAASAAVAVGVAWGIFRFFKARKEDDAIIQEYYGDQADFTVPDGDKSDAFVDEVYVQKEIDFAKIPPPPPTAVAPITTPHDDELKIEPKDATEVVKELEPHQLESKNEEKGEPVPHKPQPTSEEKPWFLRLFDPPKKAESKSRFKESESFKPKEGDSYEIKKGDTLWAISRTYGVSLDALKTANGLHGDNIYAGDKLVIPEK